MAPLAFSQLNGQETADLKNDPGLLQQILRVYGTTDHPSDTNDNTHRLVKCMNFAWPSQFSFHLLPLFNFQRINNDLMPYFHIRSDQVPSLSLKKQFQA